MGIIMSITRKYEILLDDNWTLDEVYDKLHRYQLGNNNVYYGRYRGLQI